MQVTVIGPNLRDQSKGSFHVHRAGCSDIDRDANYRGLVGEQDTIQADTLLDVVDFVYADQVSEQPLDEQESYIESLVSDFHFAPCTKGLR